MRKISLFLALALFRPSASASAQPGVAEEPYQTNVSEAEWSAAIPSTGSEIRLKLVHGSLSTRPSQPRPGRGAHAKVSILVRANGTVGVYRVVETNDPVFARDFVEALLKERFEPPLLRGKPVSVRTNQAQSIGWDR